MAGPAGNLLAGQHARRASEGSLQGLERRAEIAFQRERDREGGGLARQLAYFNRLPKMWRVMYAIMGVLVITGVLLKFTGKGGAGGKAKPGSAAAGLAGRNVTKAYTRNVPAVPVEANHFVRRHGARLTLEEKDFYFAGFCNYYILTRAADKRGSGRKEVIQTLQKAQELGMTVLRMWAFADGDTWNALQPEMDALDEDVFADGLDWVVSEAKNYGIRLLLSLTNGDTGFGGMEQYVKWGRDGAKGGSITEFYNNADIRESFKKYVGTLITRKNTHNDVYYRDDPTIFGWEIANEPSNPGDESGDVLQEWIEDLAAYVKSLDPNHLVSVGSIGWYGASTPERLAFNPPAENANNPLTSWHHPFDAACLGSDYVRNQMSSNIDIMQLHMYPDSWLKCNEECKLDWTLRWMRSHFEDALRLGKPVVLGEFGKLHHGGMKQRRTFLWMIAADTYADYDGYTIYTTKRASAAPQPKWPDLDADFMLQLQERKQFLNWDDTVACMARRATPRRADSAKPWVDGWNMTLDLISGAVKALPLIKQQQL